MLDKAFEPIIFKCCECGLERRGMEEKQCGHLYSDYKIKRPLLPAEEIGEDLSQKIKEEEVEREASGKSSLNVLH
jgi:hypothetical protein